MSCLLVSLSPCLPVTHALADAASEYQSAVGNVERGEYYTALLNLRRTVGENPTYIPAYLLMGDVYVKLGKYADADSSYQVAENGDPQSVDAAIRRLKLYAVYLKDFDQAEKLLNDVASRFGQSPDIHFYKALVLKGKHNYFNALQELRLAIALREKYFDARHLQLEIESIIGEQKRILEVSTILLDDFPDVVESYEITIDHLLKAGIPVPQILDLFSKAAPSLILHPKFIRLMARLNLIADRYEEAAEILKNWTNQDPNAEEYEDMMYLRSLSEVARGYHASGIQMLSEYLQQVPDRPYLQMQLDLWLLRYAPVNDPLRLHRAEERLRTGLQILADGQTELAFIPLYLARKLNPRDKITRRHVSEVTWQLGLTESARSEMNVAVQLDPEDAAITNRANSFGVNEKKSDTSIRRTYNLYIFRLYDEPTSVRPSFGRLLTEAIALFGQALTPFNVQALEPAVPFEKAEEVAHQKNADFFFHGVVGLDSERNFLTELGIFPVGGSQGSQFLEFKEQHVVVKSKSDFTDEVILDTIKALNAVASQYAKVVKKEREGHMIVDVGRRHGVTPRDQFSAAVFGRPVYLDVIQIYEWFTRVRIQEIERARFIGIGDYIKQVEH